MIKLARLSLLLAFALGPSSSMASDYPKGVVKLVIGMAAGGGNDLLARILADKLASRYNTNFIVENRPGANGVIAIEAVKNSEPTGYNLLVGPSSAMVINSVLLRNIRYDPIQDFSPIAMTGSFPLIVVVKSSSPFKTLDDLVVAAKSKPGSLNFSSASNTFRIATEAFMQRAGIQLQHVPYRGGAPAATAVLSEDVTVTFGDVAAVLPLVQGGQLRALAVTAPKRLASLPDTPTIAESGFPGFEMVFWSGLFAPAGTPEAIRKELETQVSSILSMTEVTDRLGKLGVEPTFMPGDALRTRIKADVETYRRIADQAGIQPE